MVYPLLTIKKEKQAEVKLENQAHSKSDQNNKKNKKVADFMYNYLFIEEMIQCIK